MSSKQQNDERIKQQLEAVKQIIADAKELAGQIANLVTGNKPVSKDLQNQFNQKENEVISELNNSDPGLATQIQANKAERQAILDKYPVANADNNDILKYLSDEDRAKYAELMQKSKDLQEQANTVVEASRPPMPTMKESGGSPPAVSYQTLMSCADISTVGQQAAKSDCLSCKSNGLCYYGSYYANSTYEYWFSSTDKKWIARSLFVDEKFVYFEKDAAGEWHEYPFVPQGLPRPFAVMYQMCGCPIKMALNKQNGDILIQKQSKEGNLRVVFFVFGAPGLKIE